MRQLWVVALLLPIAGCIGGPDIPADAKVDTDPALDDLTLSAWLVNHDDRVELHGIVENKGDSSHDIRVGCGEPWHPVLEGPDGRQINFFQIVERVGCPGQAVWDVMRPGNTKETLYSWDYRDHDVMNGTATELPAGTYVWTLIFELRDRDEKLAVSFPIDHPGGDELKGFTMAMDADNGTYTATIQNDGRGAPLANIGCDHEWSWRVLGPEGEVPLAPTFSCDGFATKRLQPGWMATSDFQWDGMAWNATTETKEPAGPGPFTVEATFHLRLDGPSKAVATDA